MIVEKLLQVAKNDLKGEKVKDVQIGLNYTGVLLENQRLGLAYTLGNKTCKCSKVIEHTGNLEVSAWQLAKLSRAPRAVDSSVGVATLNSIINQGIKGEEGPLLDFLEIKEDDLVGMVGNFKPLAKKINDVNDLYIFERDPLERDVYPDWAVEQLLPNVDVAIITGTAIANKTIDHLLDLAQNAREIAILGPTTPMAPSVFKKVGVTLLGGRIYTDLERTLKIISHGGGTKKLGEVSKKLTLTLQ